jgi:hypothetical protein
MSSSRRRDWWRWRGWHCFSSRYCSGGGVTGAGAPWAADATEAGLMMPEPLELLMRWRRGWWCQSPLGRWCGRGGVVDAGTTWAIDAVEVGSMMVEVQSMMPEPLGPLMRRRRGRWRRSPSGHWCGGGRVDDVRAPRAVDAVEAWSMTLEPLRPLMRWRWGQWYRSPLGHWCGRGNDDMLLCRGHRRKRMCATLFGASISGVSISLQMVERVICFLPAFSYGGVNHG